MNQPWWTNVNWIHPEHRCWCAIYACNIDGLNGNEFSNEIDRFRRIIEMLFFWKKRWFLISRSVMRWRCNFETLLVFNSKWKFNQKPWKNVKCSIFPGKSDSFYNCTAAAAAAAVEATTTAPDGFSYVFISNVRCARFFFGWRYKSSNIATSKAGKFSMIWRSVVLAEWYDADQRMHWNISFYSIFFSFMNARLMNHKTVYRIFGKPFSLNMHASDECAKKLDVFFSCLFGDFVIAFYGKRCVFFFLMFVRSTRLFHTYCQAIHLWTLIFDKW